MNLLEQFRTDILPMKDKLYRVALRITNDNSDAEDVVQEVLVRVWELRETWQMYHNLGGWVMQLTKNKAIDKTRSKHRKTDNLEFATAIPHAESSPEQAAALADTVEKVRKMVTQLPEKQRIVMELRDFEQLSYQEISDILEMPLNQVKVNLSRARKSIRELLIQINRYGL